VFSYPESTGLDQACKDLIRRLLVVEAGKRPSLEEILESEFMMKGGTVPKLMNLSTLAAPPLEKQPKRRNYTIVEHRVDSPKPNISTKRITVSGSVYTSQGLDSEIHVAKWIDYSSKYGLGYLLSNRNCGALFIDGTRIVLNSSTEQVFYMGKEGISEASLKDYPEKLKKKVTLLQFFKNFLEGESESGIGSEDRNLPVYVKKVMKTFHGVVFRLSNRLVQVNFLDSSQLTLNCDMRVVTIVTKTGEKAKMSLSKALQSGNAGILRRLKYTRDVIHNMIHINE
jgi:polo-like kinase 1